MNSVVNVQSFQHPQIEKQIDIESTFFTFQGSLAVTLSGYPTPIFFADHPFLYYVWDRGTKTTIFSGCIKDFPDDKAIEIHCDRRRGNWRREN